MIFKKHGFLVEFHYGIGILKHVNSHIIPALLRYENFIIEIEIIELYI